MSDKVAMPGDADEPADKLQVQRHRFAEKQANEKTEDKPDNRDDQRLGRGPRVRKGEARTQERDGSKDETKTDDRGPLSPAQYEDDGWGDTPVQMRG